MFGLADISPICPVLVILSVIAAPIIVCSFRKTPMPANEGAQQPCDPPDEVRTVNRIAIGEDEAVITGFHSDGRPKTAEYRRHNGKIAHAQVLRREGNEAFLRFNARNSPIFRRRIIGQTSLCD